MSIHPEPPFQEPHRPSGPALSRRTLLAYAGGGALGLSVLGIAGCSSDDSPNPFESNGAGGSAAKESPMLQDKIDAGDLPPLAERLPKDPMVVQVHDQAGTYGGTLHRAQTEVTDNGVLQAFAGVGLLEWNWAADGYQPSVAAKFEKNDTNTQFTFTLRDGLKWSDGKPFTSDDLLFTMQDYLSNTTAIPFPPFWFNDGEGGRPKVEAPDEKTLVMTYKQPFALFEKYMCHPAVSYQFLKPKHYLKQFHPKYAGEAKAKQLAKKAGFDTWDQYFYDRDNWWTNPDRPILGAYQVTSAADAQSGTATLERNPYYWKTDPDGRQLPYVDKLQVQVLEQDALNLRAANGDLDFQGNFLGYGTTEVYLKNAKSRGFEVLRWTVTASRLSLCVNLSHKDKVLRELFMNVDFRHALSVAIDRDEMNTALLGGLGNIKQPCSTKGSEYYVDGAGEQFLDHDPDTANKLLDGLGLTKGSDGVRRRKDGKPLALVLMYVDSSAGIPPADAFNMVKKHWGEIGVKLDLRPVDGTLYAQLRGANSFDIDGTTMPDDDWDLEPVWYIPTAANSHSAPGYGQWYTSGGKEGMTPPAEIKALMDNWDKLRTAKTDQDRITAGKAITQQVSDKVYSIGLLALPFQPVIVKNGLHNVRDDKPKLSFYYGREGITKPEQIFFTT